MPPKSSPTTFPFIPVVLGSPSPERVEKGASVRGRSSAAQADGGVGKAAGRNGARKGVSPPDIQADGAGPLRVEVERRVTPEGLTVLGAIVR